MLSASIHKFFAYDAVVGEEAQRALEDLDRTSVKEEREDRRSKRENREKREKESRDKKEDRDKKQTTACLDFNSAKGCSYGVDKCRFVHKCSTCGAGHAVKDCKKDKS